MTFEKLKQLFLDKGCSNLFFKVLAPNDNSKNQIYLGPDLKAANVLPFTNVRVDRSITTPKSKRTPKPIFKADLDFSWINNDGRLFPAPQAQIIYYPQYPEVRLSSLLKGCSNAPSDIIRIRQNGRVLLLGITLERKVLGYALEHTDPLADEFKGLSNLRAIGVFNEIPLHNKSNSRNLLLRELGRIHAKGWIAGKRISKEGIVPYNASSAGGYTLEAELGITPNSDAKPDYLGWEIKQFTVDDFERFSGKVITLFTPEPSEGFYRDSGVLNFVIKYGYEDRKGRTDRRNFGGVHRVNSTQAITGLTMILDGYETESGITDAQGGICLIDSEGELAAKWPFSDLIGHWNRKHAQAAYVLSLLKMENEIRYYSYGPVVRLGEGTDILLFLEAMHNGVVYYDPGIKVERISGEPKIKRRNQFRIKSGDIGNLYRGMVAENVII